jgi:hypothetical protein
MPQQDSGGATPKEPEVYAGGAGTSQEEAVVITLTETRLGIPAEYDYVEMQCGRRGRDWKLLQQALFLGPAGERYDRLSIRLADGTQRDFYFDITSFYGKA